MTGLDLNNKLLPGPLSSGPEAAFDTPSIEAGQSSTFNFESFLANAIHNVAEPSVHLLWESD